MALERDTATALHATALELALASTQTLPNPHVLAQASGAPLWAAEDVTRSDEAFYRFLLTPLLESIDAHLARLPLHRYPTIADQRLILAAAIDAALEHRPALRLVLVLYAGTPQDPRRRLTDRAIAQIGHRLFGIDYNPDERAPLRLYFMSQLVASAVISHRHDFAEPGVKDALIDSCLGVLNPPPIDEPLPHRRWH